MFFFPRRIALIPTLAIILVTPLVEAQGDHSRSPRVEAIRFWAFGDSTRIAIETTGEYKLYSEEIENPSRVYFDLTGLHAPKAAERYMQTIPVGDHRIRQIRVARLSDTKTRIVLDLECPVEVISSQLVNPDRLMIEVRAREALPSVSASNSVIRSHKLDASPHTSSVDSDIAETDPAAPVTTATNAPPPAVVKANGLPTVVVSSGGLTTGAPTPPPPAPTPAVAARSTTATVSPTPSPKNTQPPVSTSAGASDSSGDRSLVRVFGLKLGRVVIDAGHGGHDSGTVGPNGLMEKELVLDVALRLGALITKQMGAEVVYTRSTDVFIPLEERTRIANDQKADLFISVHANASPEPTATGVETYYFNLTTDKPGLDLATRENATSDSSISDLNDLLHRAVLQTKKEESREFAQRVQASLIAAAQKINAHVRDRGVRQAPFVVLIGATMPSILAEIGFVSNPHDEKLLRRSEQRQRIADALFKGVVQYSNSLSHVQMARAQ
jgi:N-acetylmuramoyl-L-alanine amidase